MQKQQRFRGMASPAAKSKSRGPWVAASYHDRPTRRIAGPRTGWFRTGDVPTMARTGTSKSWTGQKIW